MQYSYLFSGAWLKCAAVSPDRFPVLMVAQTVCAISQVFILGMPARVAAVWFGPRQVSTATSLGVFGNQVRYLYCSGARSIDMSLLLHNVVGVTGVLVSIMIDKFHLQLKIVKINFGLYNTV